MGDTVTLPNTSRPALLAKKRPRLHVLYSPAQGPVRGAVHSLPVGVSYVGRRLSAGREGVVLDEDPSLSGEHALLGVTDGDCEVSLQDLGSKNGTWIGANRLVPGGAATVVRDGEVVRLGSTLLLLRYEPSKSVDADIAPLVGVSLPMRELRARLARLAKEPAPVLLHGETGTGKELAARALHSLSKRSGELVIRSCAALPESLIESELFGHVADAFTGAKARLGAFRSADRGTLFLDEVGELPQSQQARLLRVIEEGRVTAIGSDTPLPCQVRLVTATHRDLQAAVEAGRFRQDLYARMAHLIVKLPPLRARREDILLLLEHCYPDVRRLLCADLVQALLLCDYRDNVRTLRSVADQLRIDGDTESLRAFLRPRDETTVTVEEALAVPPPERPYRLPAPSKQQLVQLLTKHLGTVTYLATELGCSPRQIRRWLELHDLDPDEYRVRPADHAG